MRSEEVLARGREVWKEHDYCVVMQEPYAQENYLIGFEDGYGEAPSWNPVTSDSPVPYKKVIVYAAGKSVASKRRNDGSWMGITWEPTHWIDLPV